MRKPDFSQNRKLLKETTKATIGTRPDTFQRRTNEPEIAQTTSSHEMDNSKLKTKISRFVAFSFNCVFYSGFVFLLLGFTDVHIRNTNLQQRYQSLQDALREGEMVTRHRREVKMDAQLLVDRFQKRIEVLATRLNRTDAWAELVKTPFAALLPFLRGPIGLPGHDGEKGRTGFSGQIGRHGKQGPRGIKGDIYNHVRNNTGSNIYVRWGRKKCPDVKDTELVYTGLAAGQSHTHSGGMSNTVCLHSEPIFGKYSDKINSNQFIYGVEYEIIAKSPLGEGLNNHDAPCAVCRATKQGAHMMIPGRNVCPLGWKREYKGYMMSEKYDHKGGSTAVCVDAEAEGIPGSDADKNGNLWYVIQAACGSLPCGPYVHGREMACAVCTI